jgi:hypothetical protein
MAGRRTFVQAWEGGHVWEHLGYVLFFAVVVGIPCLGWIITSIMHSWQKVRVSEHLAALKQSMIERGMSAQDIERVIKAGAPAQEPAEKAT